MGRTTNTFQGTNRRGRSADTRQASSTLFHNFLYSKVKTPTKELHCECMTKAVPTQVSPTTPDATGYSGPGGATSSE